MIKLVATDIDGTILSDKKHFTEGVRNCIKELEGKCVKVVLVTGRMYAAARLIAEELGLNTPVVSYQGGLIKKSFKNTETLYQRCIPSEDAEQIICWARRNKIHLNLYCNDILYVEKDNDIIKKYTTHQNINYEVLSFDDIKLENINKLMAIDYQCPDNIDHWVKDMGNKMTHLYVIKSTPWFCEFSTKDATKACAVNFLREYWELKENEILTIGDQDNDIELLKAGDISVAMGNATDELKKYADYITDTVDNDGFVKAMEKFILGVKE